MLAGSQCSRRRDASIVTSALPIACHLRLVVISRPDVPEPRRRIKAKLQASPPRADGLRSFVISNRLNIFTVHTSFLASRSGETASQNAVGNTQLKCLVKKPSGKFSR